MVKSSEERRADTERAKKGIKARRDAMTTLIERHKDEFEELVTANRVALGLPMKPQGATPDELRARIQREEAKLQKWRDQLAAVSGALA